MDHQDTANLRQDRPLKLSMLVMQCHAYGDNDLTPCSFDIAENAKSNINIDKSNNYLQKMLSDICVIDQTVPEVADLQVYLFLESCCVESVIYLQAVDDIVR